MEKIKIYQFTDPTCVWCWGNEPMMRALDYLYGDKIAIEYIMGGLVEDATTLFESEGELTERIARANEITHQNWIAAAAKHGMPVDERPIQLYTREYLSSFPQNIAYEAAKRIDPTKAKVFLRRMRESTFTEGLRTSQIDVLINLATESGIDPSQFIDEYTYGNAQADFMQDRIRCRRNGVTGFPSYLIKDSTTSIILGGYQNLDTIHNIIAKLSRATIKPRKIAPSVANVMGFIKRYTRVYPAEIEVLFSLDRIKTDLMIEQLLHDGKIEEERVGGGRRVVAKLGSPRSERAHNRKNSERSKVKERSDSSTEREPSPKDKQKVEV